jgi:hypothetical protein
MMTVMVMAVMYYHDYLRLCRIGNCETEGEHESEQNSFHSTQYAARQIHLQSYYDHCSQALNLGWRTSS